MLVWAGQSTVFHNDVWAFDLAEPGWAEYQPANPEPNIRYGTASVFDPLTRDLVTFAGFTNAGRFQDTWRFDPDGVAWTDVSYYVLRDFRPTEGWMTWTLDPDQTSDLLHTSGHYVVAPAKAPGTVLLSYKTQADSGKQVPQWITQMLTTRALKGYLEHVRKASEAK